MGQVFVITGTSRGIGRALAEYYLDKGETVVGCSRGNGTIEHENYRHFELDVTDEALIIKMTREVYKTFGRIDVLINNAGVASMNHFTLTPYKTAKKIVDINFLGMFLMSREIGKVMVRQKKGRIINFSTVATALNLEGEAIYASSKAAVESMTRVTAKELGGFGITVNAVGPTPIKTDLIKNIKEEKLNKLIDQQSIKRFGEFTDLYNVIDFFADEKSGFITGQVIYLGGVF